MQIERSEILRDLPPYKGNKKLIVKRQDSREIMNEITRMHGICSPQYDVICKNHWQGTVLETAKGLFNFCKNNIPYNEETMYSQSVKHPAAIIAEAHTHGGDCKHYASYIVGVCDALRRAGKPIMAYYRFAAYNPNDCNSPGHVFAVIVNENGKEIWCDPVLNYFDARKPVPINKWDKYPEGARVGAIGALYEISGVRSKPIANGTEYTMNGIANANFLDYWYGNKMIHDEKQWSGDDGSQAIGKRHRFRVRLPKVKVRLFVGDFVKKFTLAGPRNAFLALLKINFASLATDLAKKANESAKNKGQLDSLWHKLGGNSNKLHTAINMGVSRYNGRHSQHQVAHMHGIPGGLNSDMYSVPFTAYVAEPISYQEALIGVVGADDATAGGFMAVAAPVLAAFGVLLKSWGMGGKADELKKKSEKASDDLAKQHNDKVDDDQHNDDGTVDHGNGVTTKVVTDTKTGKQTMQYDMKADAADGEGEDDTTTTDVAAPKKGGGLQGSFDSAKAFVVQHKTWFIVGGAVVAGAIILPPLVRNLKHKKGRR